MTQPIRAMTRTADVFFSKTKSTGLNKVPFLQSKALFNGGRRGTSKVLHCYRFKLSNVGLTMRPPSSFFSDSFSDGL